jgi:hypothetical protein
VNARRNSNFKHAATKSKRYDSSGHDTLICLLTRILDDTPSPERPIVAHIVGNRMPPVACGVDSDPVAAENAVDDDDDDDAAVLREIAVRSPSPDFFHGCGPLSN